MKIIVDKSIKDAIKKCRPTKIAVAYVGSDWEKYIPEVNKLKKIIISPTFGTNPYAVLDIASKIGWDNVFLLNELHAKIYIGKDFSIIGSANLTNNGLSGESLSEICVDINEKKANADISNHFEFLLEKAKKQYATVKSKKEKINELQIQWGSAISNGIIKQTLKNNKFNGFELLAKDHFYISWYEPGDWEYSEEINSIRSCIEEEIHFRPNDSILKNKWVLIWRITGDSKPHKTCKPSWVYIHDIVENAILDEDYKYTKCAFQRNDMSLPPKPFEFTPIIISAFKKAVVEDQIAKYLIQNHNPEDEYDNEYSLKGLPLLINRMKELTSKF